MKKKLERGRTHVLWLKKLWLMMRLCVLLILFASVSVTATVYSQNSKLTLKMKNSKIADVFNSIEEQSNYYFFYNRDLFDDSQLVSVDMENKNVSEILDELFKGKNTSYKIVDRNILIEVNADRLNQMIQQKVDIRGKVTDSSGQPLPGVTVLLKGTTNGTITDFDGNYSIKDVAADATLVFSFVGMRSHEIFVGNQSTINVYMQEDAIGIEEVVAVGYGTQKKEVVTGAISTVKADEIAVSPSGNVAAGLAGRLPGVVINTRSGEAGNEGTTIRVRGQSTFAGSNDPLYVIDGIVRSEEGGILSRLDPNDIESITVLKDASAAIYGSRAANGVILITTKRGKEGQKPTISVTYDHSFSQPTRVVNMANSYSYAKAQNLANEIRGLTAPWNEEDLQKFADGSDPLHYPNTNWYKAVQKNWSKQDKANIQLSGGTEKLTYLVSAGLLDQGTPYKNGDMKNNMYNIRSNIDAKINDNIKVTFDLFGKKTDRVLPYNGSANGYGIYSHIGLSSPARNATWPGTNLPAYGAWGGNYNTLSFTSGEAGYTNTINWIFNGQSTIDVKLPWVKGLSVKGSLAFDYFGQRWKNFQNVYYVYNYNEDTDTYEKIKGGTGAPQLYVEERRTEYTTGNVRINYLNTFADLHTVDAFVGFEQNESNSTALSAFRGNFPTGALDELNAGDSNTQTNSGSSAKTARQNYFGRILYDYDSRYMLQFQFRYDGSQNFPEGKRFGFFPGVSAGWTISKENFMQSLGWLNNLKARGSWGKMGNDAVAAYQYMTMYTMASGSVFNGTQYQGISQANTPNPNITWETAETLDIGLEGGLLENKLTFEFDWFKTHRTGILAQRQASIPNFTGLSLPSENIGITNNKGFEFMLGFRNKTSKDFSYSLSGNFTFAQNKIEYMDETPMAEAYQKQEGKPIGAVLRYKAIGIYNEADIADPNIPKRAGTVAGDIKIWDANGDGEINSLDRIRQDLTNIPEIVYGLNIGLNWKQFDLMLSFQGQAQAVFYLREDWVNPSTAAGGGNILQWWTEDTRTPDNPDGTKPRLGTAYGIGGTTFTQISANFLKLKNAELGYNIPVNISSKAGLETARVYVSGTNLFSIDNTRKFGIDPEAGNGGWDLMPMRLVNIGVNITF